MPLTKPAAVALSALWCGLCGLSLAMLLWLGQITAASLGGLAHLGLRLAVAGLGAAAMAKLLDHQRVRSASHDLHALWPAMALAAVFAFFGGAGGLTTAMELERGEAVVLPVASLPDHGDAAFVELSDAVAVPERSFVFMVSDADDGESPHVAVPIVAEGRPDAVPAAWVVVTGKVQTEPIPMPVRGRPDPRLGVLEAELSKRSLAEPRPVRLVASRHDYEGTIVATRESGSRRIVWLAAGVAGVMWLCSCLLIWADY